MFEAYKQEMEKYLSFFDEGKNNNKKKIKKKSKIKTCAESDIQKRPVVNLGTIRDQFEGGVVSEGPKLKETKNPKTKKVGKLQAAQIFEEKTEDTAVKSKP